LIVKNDNQKVGSSNAFICGCYYESLKVVIMKA